MKMSTIRQAGRTPFRPAASASRSVSLFSHSGGDVVRFNFAYRGNDPATRVHLITRPPDESRAGRSSPYRLPPSVLPGPESFWRTGFTEVPLLTATMRDGGTFDGSRPDARGTWKAVWARGTTASDEGTTVLVGFEDGADAYAAATTEAAIRSEPGGVDVAAFSLDDARMLGGMMRVPLLLLLSGADSSDKLAAYFAPHVEPTPRIPA